MLTTVPFAVYMGFRTASLRQAQKVGIKSNLNKNLRPHLTPLPNEVQGTVADDASWSWFEIESDGMR